MGITLEQLKGLFDDVGTKYYADPDLSFVRVSFRGDDRSITAAVIPTQRGSELQFRSLECLHVPIDHPRISVVHRMIAEMNNTYRLLRIGWNADDGEVVGEIHHLLEDQTLTARQLDNLTGVFMAALNDAVGKLEQAMEEGSIESEQPIGASPALGSSAGLERLLDRARENLRENAGGNSDGRAELDDRA